MAQQETGWSVERYIHILVAAAYVVIAVLVAAVMVRLGVAAGTAWIFATLAALLGAQLHIFGALRADGERMREDISQVRRTASTAATRVAEVTEKIVELEERVDSDKAERHRELVGEMRAIEDLVRNMGQRVDTKIEEARFAAKAKTDASAHDRAEMLQIIRDALAEGRVDLHLQPIVSLPQRRARYYECFTRLRDGEGNQLSPSQWLPVANKAGIITDVDNVLLFRCVQIVNRLARQDRHVGIFCNISPASLADEDFFPQFLDFVRSEQHLAKALIFEISQKDYLARNGVQARNMARLADFGFRFSIDKVTDPALDFGTLKGAGIRFLKIDNRLMLDMARSGKAISLLGLDIMPADIADYAERFGVQAIAEKIEEEQVVPELIELNFRLAQGHLFGEPRPVRAELLTGKAVRPTSAPQAA